MKHLLKKLPAVLFIFSVTALVIFAAAKIFPGKFYILQNYFGNFSNKQYLSPIEKEELSAEKQLLSKLLEESEYNDSLLLINGSFKLSQKYEPDLIDLGSEVYLTPSAADAYWKIKSAVKDKFENNIYIMSAYRSPEEQSSVIESGNEYAAAEGASEHPTGLAVDVYVFYHAGMGFIDTEEGRFVNENCSDYGFIIRYPSYGEKFTGITYEPWHLRYVGFPHAEIISENELTLEEYILSLKIGEFYSYNEYIISRQKESEYIYLPENLSDIVISPDNTGCIIITGKK